MFFTSFMALVLLCLKGSLIFFFFARYLPRCYCIRRYFVVFFRVVHVLFLLLFFLFCFVFSARHPYTPRCGLTPSLGQASAGPSSPSIRDHFRTEELCNQAISYRLGLPSTLSSFSIDSCMLIPDKILAACNYSGLIINTGLGFFSVFIQRSSCRRLQLSAPS